MKIGHRHAIYIPNIHATHQHRPINKGEVRIQGFK